MADSFLGIRYPIVKDPRGYLTPQGGSKQIRSSLLTLILTNKNERVMDTEFGCGLNELLFEQPVGIENTVREKIISQIQRYEPRVTISDLRVTTVPDQGDLDPNDDLAQVGQILFIKIKFLDQDNINQVQELNLEVPLGASQ